MRVIEVMMRGMPHLNIGAAIAMLSWIVWSGVSLVNGERPVKRVATAPGTHSSTIQAPIRVIEEKRP